jgi:membrane-associated phospholipid phosphatase
MRAPAKAVAVSIAAVLLATASGDAAAKDLWDESRFRRFQVGDWAITGGLVVAIGTTYLVAPTPKPRWKGGVLFDGVITDAVRAETPSGRRFAARLSDVLVLTAAGQPFFDATVVAWGIHGDQDTGAEIAAISMQSYLATTLVKLVTERAIARERPFVRGCTDDAVEGFPTCGGTGDNKSFFSGHTSMAFTGAGLTCAHHSAMALYGGVADPIACVAALGIAMTTGTLRMVADEHYATDVLTGALLGLAAGFVLPWYAHYRAGRGEQPATAAQPAPLVVQFGGAF